MQDKLGISGSTSYCMGSNLGGTYVGDLKTTLASLKITSRNKIELHQIPDLQKQPLAISKPSLMPR